MYLLREENHGELAVLENPYRAVEWLWREQWLDATTECYVPGKKYSIPLFERLGFDSPKKVNHRVPAPTQKALKLTRMQSRTDVNGSYTGQCKDGGKPVQDADDL